MTRISTRSLVALGVAALALAGAGAAIAAAQIGPPDSAPRLGMQAGPQGNGVMAGGVVMDAAADYLGMTETALAAERHDGKSLAQIATEQGKSASDLEQALVDAFKGHLDTAVATGSLTDAQAAQALAQFKTQVQTVVARTATGPAFGRGAGSLGLGAGLGLGPHGGGLGLGPHGGGR